MTDHLRRNEMNAYILGLHCESCRGPLAPSIEKDVAVVVCLNKSCKQFGFYYIAPRFPLQAFESSKEESHMTENESII